MSKADTEKIKDFGKKLEYSGAEYSEVTLRDIFTQAGLNADLTERAIKDYQRYRESELSSLSILSGNEIRQIGAEALTEEVFKLKQGREIVEDILRDYLRYLNYKKEIAEIYQESKDWGVVFSTSVYSDVQEAQESFIDYIEETYQTKVKDVKHLQELTGITHLYNYWDKDNGFLTNEEAEKLAKERKIPLESLGATDEQTGAEALKQLEDTLTGARDSKYSRAMETALLEGAKYEDLLKIKPQDYGLPETDKNGRSYQYSTILDVISWEYLLVEQFAVRPDLRTIARDLEAPYSVVFNAWKLRA